MRSLAACAALFSLACAHSAQADWVSSFQKSDGVLYYVSTGLVAGYYRTSKIINSPLVPSYICYGEFSNGYHIGNTSDLSKGCTAAFNGVVETSQQDVVGWAADWAPLGQGGPQPTPIMMGGRRINLPFGAFYINPLYVCTFGQQTYTWVNWVGFLSNPGSKFCYSEPFPEVPVSTVVLTKATWTINIPNSSALFIAAAGGTNGTTNPSVWPNFEAGICNIGEPTQ